MWDYVNKYIEKYTMGIILCTLSLFGKEVLFPLELPVWKQIIVSLIGLPAMWYVIARSYGGFSTDIDGPFFTWKNFSLLFSLMLGIVCTFVAVILLGYI